MRSPLPCGPLKRQGADYDALCAALGATARGRAFLDEHARRARRKDTALALQALSRLEEQLRKRDSASEATARFHGELRALRSAVVSARTNFTRFEGMLAKRETVMALFDMLELRITEMLAETAGEAEPLAANENDLLAAAETQATLVAVHAALTTEEPLPSPAPRRDLLVEAPAKVDPPKTIAKLESHLLEPAAPTLVALEPRWSLTRATWSVDGARWKSRQRKRRRRPHCPSRNPSLRRFSRRRVLNRRRRGNRTSSP